MKSFSLVLTTVLLVFCVCGGANATLWDRGGGLIYDDYLEITWLQDANYAATEDFGVAGIGSNGWMTWYTARDWIDAMNAANHLGYNDWRLPDAYNQDGTGPDTGANVTDSEMGHMFHNNLGGTYQNFPGPTFTDGWGNSLQFENLVVYPYWSGTEYVFDPENRAYMFTFGVGTQIYGLKTVYENPHPYAWAVRDGDVAPVPEPATILLIGTGVVGFAIPRIRKKFKK